MERPVVGATRKLISICIPTYNRASYLRETLESILPQLGPDLEVVVSDNGSTDGTEEIIRQYQSRNPAIRYFRNDSNEGFDRNILRCVERADGEYVWFFGSDDVLKEGVVEVVCRRIRDAPTRPVLVYLNHEVTDNRGQILIADRVGDDRDREFASASACLVSLHLNLGFISALVLRREACQQGVSAAEFVGSGWVHLHLVLGCLLAGGTIQYVGRPSVRARRSVRFNSDLACVFVEQVDRILWDAHRRGYPWLTIYRTMNQVVRGQYAGLLLFWRCDAPAELARAFPVLFRTCWKYPWFWGLLLPLRFTPRWLAAALRRQWYSLRARRNKRLSPSLAAPNPGDASLPG